jgi:hypothetical protein
MFDGSLLHDNGSLWYICMLYVILVNIYCAVRLIFTVQCELSKLQINPFIFFFLCKTSENQCISWKTDGLARFTA